MITKLEINEQIVPCCRYDTHQLKTKMGNVLYVYVYILLINIDIRNGTDNNYCEMTRMPHEWMTSGRIKRKAK